ncbi:alpha/beta fold hydrolase [Acrocarpospora catenulata]|uniref:alpha/beta fold hydrolase n=1 Tax=Acrocarpospora catenulata TaxID=2836182 RepID=UPI001BDA46F8|nr:alpha/beta fold hydrolase [Acrocarpospora catenulata]
MTRLVLLHPLGVDGGFWDGMFADALALDLPGHGSAPCLESGGISGFADAVIDVLAGERVHLAGLSLGGLVAQEIAARRPDLVDRLVLVSTVAVYPSFMREMWRERAIIARERGLAELADPMAAMWFTERTSPAALRVRERFLAMDPEGYARACEALETADTTALTIQAPTLVVCGVDDLSPFTEAARWLHEHIADSELTWLDGKHAAVLERPREFAEAVRRFL